MTDEARTKYCKTCRASGLASAGECQQCDNGRGPELMPVNEDALELYASCHTQWRGAAFGVIGLDYLVLYAEAERLEIDVTPCLMAKIRDLESMDLERMNKRKDD